MWKVISTTYPLKDRWISVRSDVCIGEAGQVIAPYYTLDYPDFVHAVAVTKDRRFVLTRQYRHGAGEQVLDLPGGVMDPGEVDPVQTALRELLEETGFSGGTATKLASVSVDPAKMRNRLHVVLVEGVERTAEPVLEENEMIDTLLLPASDLLPLVLRGGFLNAGHIGLLMLGLAKLGMLQLIDPATEPVA
jgi:8-oxo-dGTP pyrophosphatase MutT (NUDIX family)